MADTTKGDPWLSRQATAPRSPSPVSGLQSVRLVEEEEYRKPVTSPDRTRSGTPVDTRILGWFVAVTALASIIAVVILALTGYSAAAVSVGAIGAALAAAGSIQVTVNIRR
jgi:hypothetical protein